MKTPFIVSVVAALLASASAAFQPSDKSFKGFTKVGLAKRQDSGCYAGYVV